MGVMIGGHLVEVGHLARLKSGGPLMTVFDIRRQDLLVECTWFDNQQHVHHEAFAADQLIWIRQEPGSGGVMDSTSDERTVNNVMRHEYRVLTDKEKALMKSAKDFGLVFIQLCDDIGASLETSIAKTKIEEAVMWAVKAITA